MKVLFTKMFAIVAILAATVIATPAAAQCAAGASLATACGGGSATPYAPQQNWVAPNVQGAPALINALTGQFVQRGQVWNAGNRVEYSEPGREALYNAQAAGAWMNVIIGGAQAFQALRGPQQLASQPQQNVGSWGQQQTENTCVAPNGDRSPQPMTYAACDATLRRAGFAGLPPR